MVPQDLCRGEESLLATRQLTLEEAKLDFRREVARRYMRIVEVGIAGIVAVMAIVAIGGVLPVSAVVSVSVLSAVAGRVLLTSSSVIRAAIAGEKKQ